MKTRFIFLTMIAAAVSFSCQSEIEPNGNVNNDSNNDVVENFVPGPGKILAVSPTEVDTKVAYGTANEDGSIPVVWVNQDAIKIYSENNIEGVQYTFEGENASSAVFTGEPIEGPTRYAVYPASRGKKMTKGNVAVSFGDLYNKQLFHSSLSNNSNNLKYMPMWAKETGEGVFEFQNLCGAVAFRFNDYQELRGMKITNVTLTSKSKNISGWGTINPETGELTLYGTDETDKVITVNNDLTSGPYNIANTTNKSINDEGRTGFIMALPIGTYPANDLTVTITDNLGRVFEREVTSELVIRSGELRTFPTLSFTFAYGEANCHIVKPGTSLTFDAAMRYTFGKSLAVTDMKLVKGTDANAYNAGAACGVKVIWEQAEGANEFAPGSVLSSVTHEDNKITVTAASGNGNALVALYEKNEEETIVWSWHIWVLDGLTDQIYTNMSEQGSPTFMDRNLGATVTTPASKDAVGLYYQYGRKDPFAIKKDFTPATSANYYLNHDVELTSRTLRTSSVAKLSWAIKHPSERITYDITKDSGQNMWTKGFNDWLIPSSEVNPYWGYVGEPVDDDAKCKASKGGYKTIYDPCPAGYRVPDYHYFSGLSADNATYSADAKGWNVDFDNSEEVAYYPLAGALNPGKVGKNDSVREGGVLMYHTRGMYWTITRAIYGTQTIGAAGVFYNSERIQTNNYNAARIMNYPTAANIRCLKIQ